MHNNDKGNTLKNRYFDEGKNSQKPWIITLHIREIDHKKGK